MSFATATANSYDEVPFPSQPLPQSHPDRLASVARLFGMTPAPIESCRVLELGSATGGNLIPMAERLPQSHFVGIDFSARQIASAGQTVAALGLENVDFHQLRFEDLADQLGTFDYIIGHGIFSWVSPAIQDKILRICKSLLHPQGVAYLSYNIHPGWHLRDVVRRLMCRAAPAGAAPALRIGQARRLLQFFSGALAGSPMPFAKLFKAEADLILKQTDGYVLHEHLEDENHPLYFHEFAERASARGLKYLADANPATMFATNFGAAIEQNLLRIAHDEVSLEQHMDLLRNRAFRQSFLCHDEVRLIRNLQPDALKSLYFVGNMRPVSATPDLPSAAVENFCVRPDASVSSGEPLVKAAFLHLGSVWPGALALEELIVAAAARVRQAGGSYQVARQDRETLGHNLIQCLAMGLIELRSVPDAYLAVITERPVASRVARLQARSTGSVTNRRHESVVLDEVSQNVVQLLDGSRGRTDLMQILMQAVDRGELSILRNGIPASRGQDVAGILQETLEQSLAKLAAGALLVA